MMYPTDEVLVNWNLFRKFKIIILAAFLCVWLGTGVRAYADSVNDNIYLQLGNSRMQPLRDGTFEYVIPLYAHTPFTGKYLVGECWFADPFTFYQGTNSNQIVYNYFESSNGLISGVSYQGTFAIHFANYFEDAMYNCVGYYHFVMNSELNDSPLFSSHAGSVTVNASYRNFYQQNTSQDILNCVVGAINSSADINTIIDYLYIIKNNAPLINDVLSELESQTTILNTLSSKLTQIYNKDVDLYNLIYNYINNSNNGASSASQAASDLAGKAADQKAAEASLAALSHGNMSDLDAADGLAVLDNVTNATRFWSSLVTQFSEVSGILWGVFIIALLLGLIAFILRLR